MRIAYLAASDQLGGAELALVEMIAGVRRHRVDWDCVVILPGTGPLREACAAHGVNSIVVPFPPAIARLGEMAMIRRGSIWQPASGMRLASGALRIPSYARRLRYTLARCKPTLIHSHGIKTHIFGALCRGETPLVWHLHEYVSTRPMSRVALRQLRRHCAAVVSNSGSVARDAQAALRMSQPIPVVYNAVNLHRFTPDGEAIDLDLASGLERPSGPVLRVGLVSTFGKWKGHETFLRALAIIRARLPVRGYIVGGPLYQTDGSQYTAAELESLVRILGLEGTVGFTGFQRADRAMRALDIVVHASAEPEPFGLVIAEAMACGRPLVTTGLGGAGEIVNNEIDALVTRPEDPQHLAQAIGRLAADSALRARLATRARASAEARFNPDRLSASLITLYEYTAAGVSAALHLSGAEPGIPSPEYR
jgi:glycosyltransferase involved in cell wall biosynthesis